MNTPSTSDIPAFATRTLAATSIAVSALQRTVGIAVPKCVANVILEVKQGTSYTTSARC